MNPNCRLKQATKVLGADCCSSNYEGCHSFSRIAMAASRNISKIFDALGHRNIRTIRVYLHALEDGTAGSIFE